VVLIGGSRFGRRGSQSGFQRKALAGNNLRFITESVHMKIARQSGNISGRMPFARDWSAMSEIGRTKGGYFLPGIGGEET